MLLAQTLYEAQRGENKSLQNKEQPAALIDLSRRCKLSETSPFCGACSL